MFRTGGLVRLNEMRAIQIGLRALYSRGVAMAIESATCESPFDDEDRKLLWI